MGIQAPQPRGPRPEPSSIRLFLSRPQQSSPSQESLAMSCPPASPSWAQQSRTPQEPEPLATAPTTCEGPDGLRTQPGPGPSAWRGPAAPPFPQHGRLSAWVYRDSAAVPTPSEHVLSRMDPCCP